MADTMQEGWRLTAKVDFQPFEKANNMVKDLSKSAKEAERTLSGLKLNNDLAGQFSHVTRLQDSYIARLDSEGKHYQANRERLAEYRGTVRKLTDQERSLQANLSKVEEKNGKSSKEFLDQKSAINETATAINNYKKKINETQGALTRERPTFFNSVYHASNKLNSALGTIKQKAHSAWNSIKSGAITAAAGIGTVGAAAISGAKKEGDVQQRYVEITNLAKLGGERTKQVTRDVAAMQRTGRDISIKYGKSQYAIAAGYEDLVKRGYTTKQALGALKTEVQASVASGDKFSDVTTVSSQVLEAFGMRASGTRQMIKNTRRAVNELAYSADATSTGFHSLGDSVHYFGAAAKSLHISLAESASAVGVLSNNGIEGSMGGTVMRDIILRIGNEINKIGKKNSVFDQLGITTKDLENSKGRLRSLADAMQVIWQHIKAHSQNEIQEQGFMKSIFGTTAQNAATILAKNLGQLRTLTKQTQKMGDQGTYVAKLAAKNSETANVQMAKMHQTVNAFEMEMGAKLLPVINSAGDALSHFLLTHDGKIFQKNMTDSVGAVAKSLVGMITWVGSHRTTVSLIGKAILGGYTVAKGAQFISFLGHVRDSYTKLAAASPKIRNLGNLGKQLTSRTRWADMTKGGRLVFSAAVAFDSVQIGRDFYSAITSSSIKAKRKGYGSGIGSLVGSAIGYNLGGTAGMLIGSELGQAMGPKAAKAFDKSFHPKTVFNLNNPRNRGNRHIVATTENGYYYTIGNSKVRHFQDQRNELERQFNTGHRMDLTHFLHPHDFWDFLGGTLSGGWQLGSHLFDVSYLQRSRAQTNALFNGSWLKNGILNLGHFLFTPRPKSEIPKEPKWKIRLPSWLSGLGFKFPHLGKIKFDLGLDKLFPGQKVKAAELTRAERNGKLIGVHAKKGAESGLASFPNWARNLGHRSNNFFKSHWEGMENWANKVNRNTRNGWRGFQSWSGQTSRRANGFFKSHWQGMTSWASRIHRNVRSGWSGFENWAGAKSHAANRFFRSKWNGMETWSSQISKNVRSGWNGINHWFNNLGESTVKNFTAAWNGVGRWFNDHVGKPLGKFGNFLNKAFHGRAKIGALHFANGTNWRSRFGTPAILNDGYDSPATNNRESILHANGKIELLPNHQNLKRWLAPNEDVINAKDTAKLVSGAGVHLAGGTISLQKTARTVTGNYKKITDESTKQLKRLKRNNDTTYKTINSGAKTQLNRLEKSNRSSYARIGENVTKAQNSLRRKSLNTWKGITTETNRQTDRTRKNTVADYQNMRSKVNNQMSNMRDSVTKTANQTSRGFGKYMGKMNGYAKSAMSDTIGQLNKGINGIDKAISEFGGHDTAIKPVHFASGSNGELKSNTLAVVNDAKSTPWQESIVRGGNLLLPHGRDRIIPLQAHDKVLNGAQTQEIARGFGLDHFAKGSGVSHGELKRLYEIAKRNWRNPDRTGKSMFGSVSGNLQAGSKVLATNALNTGENHGLDYWSALWEMAHTKVTDDGIGPASGLLKAVERYGRGHRYVWGAAGPSAFDCSGLVMYALAHAYGIHYPHYSGAQYDLTKHIPKSEARMGDLVFWGAGGSDHVGVYAGGNMYFSAESPSQGIHMNTLDSVVGKGRPLFGRVEGANTHGKGSDSVKAKSPLDQFVRRSAGSGFWATMRKIGDEFGAGSIANPAGDSVMRWKNIVKKALRANGFAATPFEVRSWLRVIQRESNGDPHAINLWDSNARAGIPSKGLVQTIEPTFQAYKHRGHNNIYNGYDDLLAGINYMAHKYGRGASAFARVASSGYARGGIHYGHLPYLAGENGPELITANGATRIFTYKSTRKKFKSLAELIGKQERKALDLRKIGKEFQIPKRAIRPIRTTNARPVINININGDISSKKDLDFVTDQITRKLVDLFEDLGDTFGTHDSIY